MFCSPLIVQIVMFISIGSILIQCVRYCDAMINWPPPSRNADIQDTQRALFNVSDYSLLFVMATIPVAFLYWDAILHWAQLQSNQKVNKVCL